MSSVEKPRRIAVIGTGISGMAAAWLLSARHQVTVYERESRIGGHSHTVDAPGKHGPVPVDTGFIVYNEQTYPNLTALFAHLDVPTRPSRMSLAVSLDDGELEYCGNGLSGLFAQKRNLARPRFWSMIGDLRRFYARARHDLATIDENRTLGDYLDAHEYGAAFRDDHLLPMAAAIWSASPASILDYPATSFIRFQDNHDLMQFTNRPPWRTVTGGSRAYVERLTAAYADAIRLGAPVIGVKRTANGVEIRTKKGDIEHYDDVVVATHADQALAMLDDPTVAERELLGAFRYSRNTAILHRDPTLMPRRRKVWSSWNYLGHRGENADTVSVSYWMNSLQGIASDTPLFVSLNPPLPPRVGTIINAEVYDHPHFDSAAMAAQRRLWSLQGSRNTWYCGAYFGAGFHEDGLQAGLAVAEALGGVRRPWNVEAESGRIHINHDAPAGREFAA